MLSIIESLQKARSHSLTRPTGAPARLQQEGEENQLLAPQIRALAVTCSTPLLAGKALHKWEAPTLPRRWLEGAGIIPLRLPWNLPTTLAPAQVLPLRHRGMICVSQVGTRGREWGGLVYFLYTSQLYSLASQSQKS